MNACLRSAALIVLVLLGTGLTLTVQAQQPEQQEEFIPIDQLPPAEQMAAAPLLIGAYAFVLVVLFAYLVIVARRLTAMQREVDRLDADMRRGSRA